MNSLFDSKIQTRVHGYNDGDELVIGPLHFKVKEVSVDVSSAADSFDIGWNLPANSAILFVTSNNNGALTAGAAADAWSLGPAADEDKYLISAITDNAKGEVQTTGFSWVYSAEDLKIFSRETTGTTGDTASADTLAGTTISLMILYVTFYELPDA